MSEELSPIQQRRRGAGWLQRLWIHVLPLCAPWLILFGVNATTPSIKLVRATIPREARQEGRCTWACHNHGCSPRPRLPAALTGDAYLFGGTIRGLYALGRLFSPDRARGYGAANLLVFCVLWPALMYALWVVFWRQFFEIRALQAGKEGP